MTSNDDYVLELLVEQGYVSQEEIDMVADSLRQEGETTLDILLQSGTVSEDDVLGMIASQFGMEYVHVNADAIDPAIIDVIPAETARKYGVVPVYADDGTVTVALSDPMGYDVVDGLRYVLKKNVDAVVAPRSEVRAALDRLYPESFESKYGVDDDSIDVMTKASGEGGEDAEDSDAPVIRLASMIITEAVKLRASDIHLEPMERSMRVRYRIDGALRQMDNPPKRLQAAIISRIKIMSGMKISEKRVPQDGRIQMKVNGRDLDFRVSTVPTNHGESIVMRILDKTNLSLGLPQLGFLSDDQTKFERLIGLPDGVLLVTGPTGSGKTTTLYACLGQINLPDRKIITVEDPVEYQMSGINQVQVHKDVGLDFAAALRSILRQAPNIVMIGEIRDSETADIAMEAALTGHLVFSTLHTNDAPSAVTRLLDMGVKPFLVASALRAAMAQRLVRAICEKCRSEYEPTERELKMLGAFGKGKTLSKMYKGSGCPTCGNSGYKGRKGIFEIFMVDDSIQRLIFDHSPATVLRARAREMGMRTLREDGMLKVASGMTTLEEVLRATMGDAD
ncbi:MAG: Flp pilus assembly complex ATPase component TadA [Kiritimatiellae bacterium]|nr:Flp pilus assembly complex ATPase component TadA [Kiritimatiellia bacterium]MBP5226983.1 Flp pilus assembly complex ATPase component TadA [Kiritimatiellia bacterium]